MPKLKSSNMMECERFNVGEVRLHLPNRLQSAKGLKGEKYFGKPLIIPATGMSNVPVVKQKNADTLLKAKEENKIKADIFLARR
jgi:hypothetical protein